MTHNPKNVCISHPLANSLSTNKHNTAKFYPQFKNISLSGTLLYISSFECKINAKPFLQFQSAFSVLSLCDI